MTCADLDTLLCEYVDGTVHGELKASVERHLAGCPACATLARDAAAAVEFLERVPDVEPPDELVTRLLFEMPTAGQSGRRRGIRDLLARWTRPVLQPRFAMGMAMTILSFSLLGKFVGVSDRPLRPSDLHPGQVLEQVDGRLRSTWDSIVKYYDNLRVVIEIQSRLNEWTLDSPEADESNMNSPEAEGLSDSPAAIPETDERSPEQ